MKTTFNFSDDILKRGAIIGHTSTTTAKLWIRTKTPGDYTLVLSTSPLHGYTDVKPEVLQDHLEVGQTSLALTQLVNFTTETVNDNIYVCNFSELSPDTCYNYAVIGSQGWELGSKSKMSFETMSETSNKLSFATYSCHQPFRSKSESDLGMWPLFSQLLHDHYCSFAIGTGDQIYADGKSFIDIWRHLSRWINDSTADISEEEMVGWYREAYRAFWGFADVRKVMANIPQYMICDDHEFKDGWGSFDKDKVAKELSGSQSSDDAVVQKKKDYIEQMGRAALKVYKEYQHCHNPKTEYDGFDYTMSHNGNDFFVLDMRTHKDIAQGQVLGDEQTARFHNWLTDIENSGSSAPFFIVSPVPMVHLVDWLHNQDDLLTMIANQLGGKDDLSDHWEHKKNKKHLKEIMQAVFNSSSKSNRPAVFLSGDVHVAAVFKLSSNEQGHEFANVTQVTSSPISYPTSGSTKLIAKKGKGIIKDTPFHFERISNGICTNNNIALIRTEVEGGKTTVLHVKIMTKDKYGKATVFDQLDLV